MADQGSVLNSTEMADSSPAMHLSKAMAYGIWHMHSTQECLFMTTIDAGRVGMSHELYK